MTKYNILKVKLSNSQLNKLKSGIKNDTEVTFSLSMWLVILMIKHLPHKLLFTNTQASRIDEWFIS